MDYRELFHWADRFHQMHQHEEEYMTSLHRRDVWENLAFLDTQKINEVVLRFLHKWGRMARVVGRKKAPALEKKLRNVAPCFDVLIGTRLADLDFQKHVNVLGEEIAVVDVIRRIFNEISTVAKATATSKITHMANPQLFIMWDQDIRIKAGCLGCTEGYLNFMIRMRERTKGIMSSYCSDHNCSIGEAENQIAQKYGGKPLTKLLDENNWVRIKDKLDPGWIP
jgi:hypothetical protein